MNPRENGLIVLWIDWKKKFISSISFNKQGGLSYEKKYSKS